VELQLEYFCSSKSPCKHPSIVRRRLDEIEKEIGTGLPDLAIVYRDIYNMNTQGEPILIRHCQRALKMLALRNMPPAYFGPVGHGAEQDRFKHMARAARFVDYVATESDGTIDHEVDEDYVQEICQNLAHMKFTPVGNVFRLVHKSVIEALRATTFFQSESLIAMPHSSIDQHKLETSFLRSINTSIAETCLARMGGWLNSDRDLAELGDDRNFVNYAFRRWAFHLDKSSEAMTYQELTSLEDPIVQAWEPFRTSSILDRMKDETLIPYLWKDLFAADGRPSRLFTATIYGNTAVIDKYPLSDLTNMRNLNGVSCAEVALRWGEQAILEALDSVGINITDIRSTFEPWNPCSPEAVITAVKIKGVATTGPTSWQARTQDIRRVGPGLDVRDEQGRTALLLMASRGESVAKLLELGVDVNAQDNDGNNCAHEVITVGRTQRRPHATIANLHACVGVDGNHRNKAGKTAMSLLAEYEQGAEYPLPDDGDIRQLAKCLLDFGASTEELDKDWIEKYIG
jgi:hypothetical protein